MTIAPQQWWQRGATTELAGRRVFAVDAGAGPDLTLLHGYPASSLEWEGVLEADAPIAGLVWGMADPVSGAHVLASVRGTLPQARVVELDGVGHCPHIEVPEAWATRVVELLA